MDTRDAKKFHYVCNYDLKCKVQIKIGTLTGNVCRPEYDKLLENPMLKFSGLNQCGEHILTGEVGQQEQADLKVECQVYADGQPLSLPVTTSYKAFTHRWDWNEWVTLPVLYSDLPCNALLALTIFDCAGPDKVVPVGGTTVSLFDKHSILRQGISDLCVWPNMTADGNEPSTTSGKGKKGKEQTHRLTKLKKKYGNSDLPKIDWLDRLTFPKIETICDFEKRKSHFMYLMIEFPVFEDNGNEYSVIYFERSGDSPYHYHLDTVWVTIPDPEILRENLVERKHRILARSIRSGIADRDLKPEAATRDQLNAIVEYPPTKLLSNEEQDLIWKYRFYLSNQKKALTKFLKCVNWNIPTEADQAVELLAKWSPIDPEDALELLSRPFTYPHVRRYAVSRIAAASDEDLCLYLLPLVHALRYENMDDVSAYLERFTVDESVIMTNRQTSTSEENASVNIPTYSNNSSSSSVFQKSSSEPTSTVTEQSPYSTDLVTFLVQRSCCNDIMAIYFHWYLMTECEDEDMRIKNAEVNSKPPPPSAGLYERILKLFLLTLQHGSCEWRLRRSYITQTKQFLENFMWVFKSVNQDPGNRIKKTELMKNLVRQSEQLKRNVTNIPPIPLPLDPEVYITGIIPDEIYLYKSSYMPLRLTFNTVAPGEPYIVIFKNGDDLRQDQLVLLLITLMDKILQKGNLDLKLTPYRVLATGVKQGFVQYVKSYTISEVLSSEGSILNFLRKFNPCEGAPYGVAPEVLDAYVKSCAGYCVITYILGVGDRHMDNLLLTETGKLFHIDFGYILGHDPKPLPPPMKLTKDMIEGMGGMGSEHYQTFTQICYTAFQHLRRNSNVILNLFLLMVDASIPAIIAELDKAVLKVQDKFLLGFSDEEVVKYLHHAIEDSVSDVVSAFVEQLHKFAQYWRK